MKVVLAEVVEKDIAGMLVYLMQKYGTKEVVIQANKLNEALEFLSTVPDAGYIRRDVGHGRLAYPVGEYLLIYEIRDEASIILMRVLHSSMDFSSKN